MSFGINVIKLAIGVDTAIPLNVPSVTDGQIILKSFEWSLKWELTGLIGGPPRMVVEGSDDNINFFSIVNDENGGVIRINLVTEIGPVIDSIFPYKFFRIRIIPNSSSAGTGVFTFTIVQDT